MRIPKSFQLHGQTIKIVLEDRLTDETDAIGQARFRKNEIAIQGDNNGSRRLSSHQEQNFYHELVHFLLYHMRETELNDNEKFVDNMASLLHQALATAKY